MFPRVPVILQEGTETSGGHVARITPDTEPLQDTIVENPLLQETLYSRFFPFTHWNVNVLFLCPASPVGLLSPIGVYIGNVNRKPLWEVTDPSTTCNRRMFPSTPEPGEGAMENTFALKVFELWSTETEPGA